MEISVETLISIATLLLGGGTGAVFTWKYAMRKSKAEAEQAEAGAKQAEVTAAKEMQDMYQQLIDDVKKDREDQRSYIEELRTDRNHLRTDRDEMRKKMEKYDDDIMTLKRDLARYGRQVEGMRPFMCGDLSCPHRQRVTALDIEVTKHVDATKKKKKTDGEDK